MTKPTDDRSKIATALLRPSILPNALQAPSVPVPQQSAGQFGDMNWAMSRLNQLIYDRRLRGGVGDPTTNAKIFERQNFIKTGGQSPLTLHLADKAMYG